MIPWVILSVIVILTFFFFITRFEKGSKEVILKNHSSKLHQHTDTEFAEESNLERYLEEMEISKHRQRSKKVPEKQKVTRKFVAKSKGEFETGDLQLQGNIYDLNLKSKAESTLKVIDQLTVLEWDASQTPDHVIQIGEKPVYIPGHDMPINLELTPMFLAFPKDPYWVHLTWILPESIPTGDLEIKIKNLSQQTETYQRINSQSKSWYLYLNQPDQHFHFELGVRDKMGRFQPILCSNEIKTPADRPSSVIDRQWLAIEEFYGKKIISVDGSPEFIMEVGKLGGSEQFGH